MGTEGCGADLGRSGKKNPRQMERKASGLTCGTAAMRVQDRRTRRLLGLPVAQRQGEPKTDGTEGFCTYMEHSGKESPRQMELASSVRALCATTGHVENKQGKFPILRVCCVHGHTRVCSQVRRSGFGFGHLHVTLEHEIVCPGLGALTEVGPSCN